MSSRGPPQGLVSGTGCPLSSGWAPGHPGAAVAPGAGAALLTRGYSSSTQGVGRVWPVSGQVPAGWSRRPFRACTESSGHLRG